MSFALSKWLGISNDVSQKTGSVDLERLVVDSQTAQGQRSDDNQDAYLALGRDRLFVVADGMGGHAGGRIASRMAVDTIYNRIVEANHELSHAVIVDAIRHSHQRISHNAVINPQLRGMGTTLVLVWLEQRSLHCFHVGDSRAYRWRNFRLEQLTQDHVSQQTRANGAKPGLSRALGGGDELEIDYQIHDWQRGDSVLLCSDGITDALADYRISNILVGGGNASDRVVNQLIDQAEQSGGSDDKTVVWIEERLV